MIILVVGCGSIGKRHVQNLVTLQAGQIIAYDSSLDRRREVTRKYAVNTFSTLEEALSKNPDIVFICTPTSLHIAPALTAARRGCHLFIEKPISDSLKGVNELIEIASQKGLVTMVGYNMRFHPAIKLMKELLDKGSIGRVICARIQTGEYLPERHPWEDYRQGYGARKDLGGGVILDSIHEIDYIMWYLGYISQIFCFSGKLSSLEIDTEDTAEILLKFNSGTIAEVHLDYIQRAQARTCQIIGEEGTIIWDKQEGQVRLYTAATKDWQIFTQAADYDNNQMYMEEIKYYLTRFNEKVTSTQDLLLAKQTLEVAIAAKESAKTGKVIKVKKSSRIVLIVQARMGSTRLPGKVMQEIMGKPMLWHVIDRLKQVKLVDKIVIATGDKEANIPIIKLAEDIGVDSFVGSEEDVLDRYFQAATKLGADVIVRITADCPLIDPHVVDRVVQRYLMGDCDFATNSLMLLQTFPDGMAVEVFDYKTLLTAWNEAKLASEREHVTPYIWKNPNKFRLVHIDNSMNISHLRWSVDEASDMEFVRQVYKYLYKQGQFFYMDDVLELMKKHPNFKQINERISINEGYAKSLREDRLVK